MLCNFHSNPNLYSEVLEHQAESGKIRHVQATKKGVLWHFQALSPDPVWAQEPRNINTGCQILCETVYGDGMMGVLRKFSKYHGQGLM